MSVEPEPEFILDPEAESDELDGIDESIDELELEPAPVPIELEESIDFESSSLCISEEVDEEGVLVEPVPIPAPVPVLASDPIVELDESMVLLSEDAPDPIDVESDDVEDEDGVIEPANAGTAIADTTSDVQINFFIKPP